MFFKKQNLSFILGFLLIILMYKTPKILKDLSNEMLGRVILVGILSYLAIDCDIACAIIFAIIILVLMHDNREGFVEGNLKKLVDATTAGADNIQGFKSKEGMKEDEEEDDGGGKVVGGDGGDGAVGAEGFVGLDDMKNVTNKLKNYLGFSITDLDRFMKTSGEKNTIASTKDH